MTYHNEDLITRKAKTETCFYNIPGQNGVCQSWPVVQFCEADILVRDDVHSYELYHCFYFTLSFYNKVSLKNQKYLTIIHV